MNGPVPPRVDRARAAAERGLTLGVALAIATASIQTAAHLANEFLLDGEIEQFDVDAEGNAIAWAASVTIFGSAIGAFLHGLLGPPQRRQYFAIAAIMAFLSLDEMIAIHERIGLELGAELAGLPDYVGVRFWLLVFGPLLLGLIALLVLATRDLHLRSRRFVFYGIGFLALGIALEAAGLPTKWLAEQGVVWPDTLRIAAEEATEIVGFVLLATGLLAGMLVRAAEEHP